PCVLGHPPVASGTSRWDVEVPPGASWAVGVAKGPPKSSEDAAGTPDRDLWSMGLCQGQFWALSALER
ncbi:BT2A1 protein, partial [Columbina picui]|nr:BT2A1 protein [Columbina picui]NWQ84920.1 BT2A1 protein [Columbina picui]